MLDCTDESQQAGNSCLLFVLVHLIFSCEHSSSVFGCLSWFYYLGPALYCWLRSFVVEGIFLSKVVTVGMNLISSEPQLLTKTLSI